LPPSVWFQVFFPFHWRTICRRSEVDAATTAAAATANAAATVAAVAAATTAVASAAAAAAALGVKVCFSSNISMTSREKNPTRLEKMKKFHYSRKKFT
jgi:hypothetical protein